MRVRLDAGPSSIFLIERQTQPLKDGDTDMPSIVEWTTSMSPTGDPLSEVL